RIRDNGTGIPPEVREKMFNPFFTTKPAGEGTGLGLSISHDIVVKQHGGAIEVDTQPGEFTEIRIILPRAAVFVGESAGRGESSLSRMCGFCPYQGSRSHTQCPFFWVKGTFRFPCEMSAFDPKLTYVVLPLPTIILRLTFQRPFI